MADVGGVLRLTVFPVFLGGWVIDTSQYLGQYSIYVKIQAGELSSITPRHLCDGEFTGFDRIITCHTI